MRFPAIDALIERANAVSGEMAALSPIMQRIAASALTGDRRSSSEWTPLRAVPSLGRGRAGTAMVPLSDLAKDGWRVVPLPEYHALVNDLPPRLDWPGWHWAALPPDDGEHGAQIFRSRSEAQAYASAHFRQGKGVAA
ncbi:hypothetical protein GXW71_28265 [Roseomonas hellenica]|uniref:Uncharacterized protein n=1 Tax=Plastoroseomonas hellenica TaxID=2687306 RepID=A0ABS5F829_9PROT|nr:hypothetical protein [Plastoroseomonas hellenica]MBR0668280.1 hypothetical protein [Plastoroseomonas hellenica]